MDFFLFDGRIWQGRGRFAESMILRRGRIAAVGRQRELRPYAEGCTFLSCGGRTVIPGLLDACLCPEAAASPLPKGENGLEKGVQGWMAAHPRQAKRGARLYWRSGGAELSRARLERLWPYGPLVLEDGARQAAWANAGALALLERRGLPPGLRPHMEFDGEGRPTGRVSGPVCGLLADCLPRESQKARTEALLRVLRQAGAAGVTSLCCVTREPGLLAVARGSERQEEALPRVQCCSRAGRRRSLRLAGRLTPPEQLAAFRWQPGQPVIPVPDGPALDVALEGLSRWTEAQRRLRRPTLLGLSAAGPAQLGRIGALAPGVTVFPSLPADTAPEEHILPLRTLLGLGVPVAFGGWDSLQPFAALQAAVFREDREALTVEQGLECLTAGGQATVFSEDSLGRLRPGYLADVLVLEGDPFSLPAGQLGQVRPVLTLAAGQVLHREI